MGGKSKVPISLYQVKSFPIFSPNLKQPKLENQKHTSIIPIYT
ncbi:uncharacterized protein METZ01_LOCUS117555 [marine metagenome]|uniref:Uncharacterized protein n=1 Tax=marine metagenome TaxID=408172 RepID=A0A381XJQ2_9ZZZZ